MSKGTSIYPWAIYMKEKTKKKFKIAVNIVKFFMYIIIKTTFNHSINTLTMTYKPYEGMNSPFFPGYDQAYSRCDCGNSNACGAEHRPAVTVRTIARATKDGKTEHVTVTEPIGRFYAETAKKAFAVWDGSLNLAYLSPPKKTAYRPPGVSYICTSRPAEGASLCSTSMGSSGFGTCDP